MNLVLNKNCWMNLDENRMNLVWKVMKSLSLDERKMNFVCLLNFENWAC